MAALYSLGLRACLITLGLVLVHDSAEAYVNGGDRKNNLDDIKAQITAGGFFAAIGRSADRIDPNAETFDSWVKQLTARAIAELPPKDRELMTQETRDELAAVAKEVLAAALKNSSDTQAKRNVGPFECKVGVMSALSWWETNYEREGLRIHARRVSGYCPFIALKLRSDTNRP